MYLGLGLWAAGVLLMSAFPGPSSWLALRLLLSLGFGVHWILGEAWINAAATEQNRGRVIGTYVTLSTLGFAAGPIMVDLTGFDGALPFFVIAAFIAAAAVPLLLMPKLAQPVMPRATDNLANAARRSPLAMTMALVAGFCDVALAALLPIYGVKSGLSVDTTMALLVAFLIGTAGMQWPLGWLAERIERPRLAAACAFLVIAAAAVLPRLLGSVPVLVVVMFLWGGAQIGFYTLGLIELGSKFSRAELVGANTVFAFLYGIGALSGPLAGGAMMDAQGTNGLPATLAAAAAVLFVLALPACLRPRTAGRVSRDS